jgi:GR25 family glycosyltransferase involved in LPS biosynthesis
MSSWSIEQIPSFCITLERRTDRWKRFQDQPGLQGLSVKRFLGVDGKTLDPLTDNRIATLTKRNIIAHQRRSHEELDSIGGVGCALSHIAVWKWMVENRQEMCLVFEDDAMIPDDFISRANKCIRDSTVLSNPTQWEMWLLGGIWDDLSSIGNEKQNSLVRIGAFMLGHAYVITLPCAKRFLEDVFPIHAHIDMWMSIYGYLHNLRYVGCMSLQLKQNQKVKTDIQSEKGCAICDVPVGFQSTHTLIPKWEFYLARGAEVALVGLGAYWIYRRWIL